MTRRGRQHRHRRAAAALIAGAAAALALPLCLAAIAFGGAAGAGLSAGPAAHEVSTAALDNVHRFLHGDFTVRLAPPLEASLRCGSPAAVAGAEGGRRAGLAHLARESTFGESRLL